MPTPPVCCYLFFFGFDMIKVEDLAYDLLYSVRLPSGDTAVIVRLPYKSYDPHATGVTELKRYPNKLYDRETPIISVLYASYEANY